MMSKKLVIHCEEANHVCDKSQYKEASLWEKIKLNIHLIYCRTCRKYTKNNKKLTKAIHKSKLVCMDKQCKASMKQVFNKALKEKTD